MTFVSYLLGRVAATAVLFALIACACFLLLEFVPGSFFDEMRIDPQVSPNTIAALRAAHGLSKPGLARFAAWTWSALHGDLGISFASNRPVGELLLPRVRNTLLLTLPSLCSAWILGVTLGVWSASAGNSLFDKALGFLVTAIHTVPELVLCCLALLAAARTGLLPVGGMSSPSEFNHAGLQLVNLHFLTSRLINLDLLRYMALPVAVLTALAFPVVFWHARAAVLDAAELPFVRSARAHGLSRRTLLWRHILPVAANPLLSLGGMSIGGLLSASLLTEVLFSWPGIGPLFLDAIGARDPYLIIAAVLCSAALLITGNLLADLALHLRDPRLLRSTV